jgi:cytochrome c biogenesis protein ResB
MLKKIFFIAGSMKSGMFLFAAVILFSTIGTVIPQQQNISNFNPILQQVIIFTGLNNIYKSSLFLLLLSALTINTSLCTFNQLLSLISCKKLSLKNFILKWGIWFIHFSVFLIALGGIISFLTSYNSQIMIPEGGSYSFPLKITGGNDYRIELVDFSIDYYENGDVSDWKSQVRVYNSENSFIDSQITVNHPHELNNISILQSSFSFYYEITAANSILDKTAVYEVYSREYLTLDEENDIGIVFLDPDIRDENTPIVIPYLIIANQEVIKEGFTIPDLPVIFDHKDSFFTVKKINEASGFIIRYNPGLKLVWVGFLVMVLGVLTLPFRNSAIVRSNSE